MMIDNYKDFIDGLVKVKKSAVAGWVVRNGFPNTPDNSDYNKLLACLTPDQKEVLARMLQREKEGGIHAALAYMYDMRQDGKLDLLLEDKPMPVDPFGTETYFDFVARCEGDDWPEPD